MPTIYQPRNHEIPALVMPDGFTVAGEGLSGAGYFVVAESAEWDRAMFFFQDGAWSGELLKDDSFYAVDADGNITFVYTEVEGGSGDDPDLTAPVEDVPFARPDPLANYQPPVIDMGVLGLDTDFLA